MNAMEGMLAPLDAARARVLRFLGPFASPLLADREARVGVYGAFAITAAFALTCTAPRWVLTFGPLALGVPHLIADVRYLVVRTGLHRRSESWIAVGFPVLVAGLVGRAGVGLLAPLGAALAARAAAWKRGLALVVWGAIGLWARQSPPLANLVIAHGHNLLAVGVFWAWTARRRRHHWPALAAFLGVLTLLGSGMLDGLVSPLAGAIAHGSRELKALMHELATPGDSPLAPRLLLVFAFTQSVHYAVWLRLIPEEDRARPGLRSFASSLRALELDLGRPFVLVACIGVVVVLVWGLVDAGMARHAYLRVGGFHAYLELAVVTLLLLEGRIPLRRPC
jgi:hypothetical protein